MDGGVSVSDFTMQFHSDLLHIPVDRPEMVEPTAFGAAALAGLAVGVWKDLDELRDLRVSERVFAPQREETECAEQYRLWKRAVERARDWAES